MEFSSLTKEQKLRLDFYKEFGKEEAKDAFEFVMEGSKVEVPSAELKDGVYIVYSDKEPQLFDGTNPKEGVIGIGVKLGERRTCVTLHNVDKQYTLLPRDTECPREGKYLSYIDGVNDMDGIANTKHLKELGCEIPLGNDEHIPSLGEATIIQFNYKKVNEALEYVGGETLDDDDYYWTSTEYSSTGAWGVSFYSFGGVGTNGKTTYSGCVRPVSTAF